MFINIIRFLIFLLISFSFVTSVFATNATDPANRARALYYYVNGPPAEGYPAGYNGPAGPSTGLLDYFNSIIYDPSVEQAFADTGVGSCSEIPGSGFLALPSHTLGNISFEYTVGKKVVPSHFLKSGESVYQKGLKVLLGTTHIATIELNCPDSSGTATGYMSRQDGNRQVEVYFQYEIGSKRRQLDIFSTNVANDDEKFAARIETTDGVDYKIWGVKTSDGADGSYGVAVSGNKNSKKANIKVVKDTDTAPDNTVTVDDGVLKCVNLNNNTEDQTAGACAVAVEDPGKSVKGDDFSIQATSKVIVDTPDPLVANATVYDFGDVDMSTTAIKIITITNTNDEDAQNMTATPLAAPFSFVGGIYPGGGTCAATLAAGASCTIVVEVDVFFSGPMFGGFELQYDISSTPVVQNITSITLTANGVSTTSGANLVMSDLDPYDFGDVAISSSVDKTFTLANTGGSTATNITTTGLVFPLQFKGGGYPGTGGDCSGSLAPGATCSVVISFNPVSAGLFTGALSLSYSGNVASLVKNLIGTGTTTALLIVTDPGTSSTVIDFGNVIVDGSVTKILNLQNVGSVPAMSISDGGLIAPFSFSGGAFPGTVGTCGATLAGGASCTISVDFDPTTIGHHSGLIDISYNDGVGAVNSVTDVIGYSTSGAALAFNDVDPYDFGAVAVGAIAEYTFTLANYGAEVATSISPLGLTAPFAFKGGSFPGTGGDCGTSLSPSMTCSIVVTYSPTAVATDSDDLDISYNNGSVMTNTATAINATAGSATLTISDGPTYDYGAISVGSSVTHTFTVTNSGTVTAQSLSAFGLATPFTFTGGTYPGAGGTCALVLAGGATCTLVINFTPIATGAVTDTLEINYTDGVTASNVTTDVTGAGTSQASLVISETDPYDYGSVAIGAVQLHTFVVSNVGATIATAISDTGLAAPFEFSGGSYPGIGGTCGASLAEGNSCTLVLSYSPVTTGINTETLSFVYNDGVASQTVARSVQGTGATPAVLVLSESDPYDYGSVVVGTNAAHTFVITNIGGQVATAISESSLSAPFNFAGGYPGAGGDCSSSLAPGATCNIVVKFSPAVAGTANGTISINYNDGVTAQSTSRLVVGQGSTTSLLTISDGPTYNYGDVVLGNSVTHTFTVTNSGGADATSMAGIGLTGPYQFEGGIYPGTTGTCFTTLVASGSCTVTVTFSPVTAGAVTNGLEVSYYDGTVTQIAGRTIVGTGASAAVISISDVDPYDFGNISVGATISHTFTLTNTGGVVATGMTGSGLALPYEFMGGSYPGSGGSCTSVLAPGTNCTVVVSFAPSITGISTDTFDLNYNDGVTPQVTSRNITGTAVNAASLVISESDPYNYGSVVIGGSATHTFVVSNIGGSTATSISATALTSPFDFLGGSFPGIGGTCGTSLAPAASCDIVVTFQPVVNVTSNDSITLNYNDGSAVQSVARSVTGTGLSPALLVISDAGPYDFGTVTIGGSANHTFTVTNTSGGIATALSEVGLANPFSFVGGTYPGVGGTCGTLVTSAGNCTIVIEFSPTVAGVQTDTILLNYNDGTSTQVASRNLVGTGN